MSDWDKRNSALICLCLPKAAVNRTFNRFIAGEMPQRVDVCG